jgi:hypothetical protein
MILRMRGIAQGIGRGELVESIGVMAKDGAVEHEDQGCRRGHVEVGLSIGPDFSDRETHREASSS